MLPDIAKLRRSLVKHERLTLFPYQDTKEKITIGIGYNLTDRGVSMDWVNGQFTQDVHYYYERLSENEWFNKLNADRQIVLIDMCFMGYKKFLEFKRLIAALENEDFETAANEMLDSEWAREVKDRSVDLSEAMRKGIYDV